MSHSYEFDKSATNIKKIMEINTCIWFRQERTELDTDLVYYSNLMTTVSATIMHQMISKTLSKQIIYIE